MKNFPEPGKYIITSNPIFLVVKDGQREVVVLDAKLTLETGRAYMESSSKKRRVDLDIQDWEAHGTSKLLGTDITLRMQHDKGAAQTDRPSFVEAHGDEDFPATAQFVLPYSMATAMGEIGGLVGVTHGTINAFPPRPNDLFQMEKAEAIWSSDSEEKEGEEKESAQTQTIEPVLCAC